MKGHCYCFFIASRKSGDTLVKFSLYNNYCRVQWNFKAMMILRRSLKNLEAWQIVHHSGMACKKIECVNVHEIKILKSMYGWLAQTQPIHGYIFSIMVFCARKASYLNVKLCEIGNLNPPNFIFVPIGMPLFMAHLVLQVACQQ